MTTNGYHVYDESEFYNGEGYERTTYVVVDAVTGHDLGLVDLEYGYYRAETNDGDPRNFRSLREAAEFVIAERNAR